jgi:hypothetical protein
MNPKQPIISVPLAIEHSQATQRRTRQFALLTGIKPDIGASAIKANGHRSLCGWMMVAIAVLAVLQMGLGADPVVIALAAFGAVIAILTVYRRPLDVGSWFAFIAFAQMYGFAWLYKSILFVPLDRGLPMPQLSMIWGAAIVGSIAIAVEFASHARPIPIMAETYGDKNHWIAQGWILYIIGQAALLADGILNEGYHTTTGVFAPFCPFAIAGSYLIASYVAMSGRVFSRGLTLIVFIATIETLVFNQKSTLLFSLAAVGLPILIGRARGQQKLVLIAAVAIVLIAANFIIFPAVHVMRSSDFRDKPLDQRIDIILSTLSNPGKDEGTKVTTGDIWDENTDFIPTDSNFLMRFGSLNYLAITLKFGEAGSYNVSAPRFLWDCAIKSLPGSWSGEKEYTQLADRMWMQMDRRMRFVSNETMGPFASSRLIFGDSVGLLFVATELLIVIFLCYTWYGRDIRSPLPLFFLLSQLYLLLDGDVEYLTIYLFRMFWQLSLLFWLIGSAGKLWNRELTLLGSQMLKKS